MPRLLDRHRPMDAVLALAETIAGLSFEGLPASTVANTKRLILAALGVAGSLLVRFLHERIVFWERRSDESIAAVHE